MDVATLGLKWSWAIKVTNSKKDVSRRRLK